MGELYEPYPKLPKNIRQIGERDQVLKLYVEDYVNTYLKRLHPSGGADLRVGLLLGNVEMHEDTPYVFVDGALEMEGATQEGEKVAFTEESWKKAYQDVEQMFPKRTVQGWFLCGSPGCNLSPINYWKQHGRYFTGKHQLMYLNSGLEGEEALYITSPDGFYKLRGYSIFYERNQMMQDYMILHRDTNRAETGVDDQVIRDFKRRMDERKTEVEHHRGTVGILTGLCSVLAITVLAGGVAMFNNFQKMHQMEGVIASAIPGGHAPAGSTQVENPSGKGWTGADGPDYIIEEAKGQIFPTTAGSGEGTGRSESAAQAGVAMGAGRREADTAGESVSKVTLETMPEGGEAGQSGQDAEQSGRDAGQSGQDAEQSGQSGQASQEIPSGEAAPPIQSEAAKTQESAARSAKAGAEASGSYQIYNVTEGETLYGICYKLYQNLNHLDEIRRVNALEDENSIFAGQKLLVP